MSVHTRPITLNYSDKLILKAAPLLLAAQLVSDRALSQYPALCVALLRSCLRLGLSEEAMAAVRGKMLGGTTKRQYLDMLFILKQDLSQAAFQEVEAICLEAAIICKEAIDSAPLLYSDQRAFLSLLGYVLAGERAPNVFQAITTLLNTPFEHLDKPNLQTWLDHLGVQLEQTPQTLGMTDRNPAGLFHPVLPISGMDKIVEHLNSEERDDFLHLLAGSISLTKKEKITIINSFSKLKKIQYDNLLSIFKEEIKKFQNLSKKHYEQLWILCLQHAQEWLELHTDFLKTLQINDQYRIRTSKSGG